MIEIKQKDVLLGRGPVCYRHPGNVMFRKLIQEHCIKYTLTTPRFMKKYIVESLIDKVHESGSRFLVRLSNGWSWHVAHLSLVQAKVGHALRDARILGNDRVCLASNHTKSSSRCNKISSNVTFNMNNESIHNNLIQAPIRGIKKKSKLQVHRLEKVKIVQKNKSLIVENEKYTRTSATEVYDHNGFSKLFGKTHDYYNNTPRFRCVL
jgi:hypothetical protein